MKTYTLQSDGVLKRYDYLWRMTPDRWAWEYLRRNEEFLEEANAFDRSQISCRTVCHGIRILKSRVPQTAAERWGLIMMPNPQLNGIDADVVWNTTAFPDQVELNVVPRGENEVCEIYDTSVAVARISHFTDSIGREFLLTRGNGCVFQTRCNGISLLGMEQVRMKLQISDFESYDRKVKAQQEGMRVFGTDPDAETPKWTKRTHMLRDGLIVLDSLKLGMSRREIAIVLYGKSKVEAEWQSGHMKDAIRYLVQKAEALRDGGYLVELLGGHVGPVRAAA